MIFKRKRRNIPFFVIISPPRCRSSYVDNLLRTHPDVICHSEIFFQDHPIVELPDVPKNDLLFDLNWRDSNPREFIERVLLKSHEQAPHARMMGCKLLLFPYQMNRGLDALLSFKPQVIYLSRKNELAWYSSLKIAIETGVWYTEKHLDSQHKVTFNKSDFQYHLDGRILYDNHALHKFQLHKIRYLSVEYESLSQASTITSILQFLNLPAAVMTSNVVEQNTRNILDRFVNREEVIAYAASIGKMAWIEHAN